MCFFDLTDTTFANFDYITLFIFWADIIFNLRTTYFNDNNEEVVDGKKCLMNYVSSGHFYIDIISAVPFRIFFSSNVQNLQLIKAFKIIKILRMLRMKRFQSYFADDQFKILSGYEWLLLFMLAMAGQFGQTTFSRGYQVTEASKISSFTYTEIAFGFMFDITVLGHPPDRFSIIGSVFILISAIILKRDKE